MRILIVTSQDSGAGAPRAIHRVFSALRESHSENVDVFLRVIHKSFNDDRIIGGKPSRSGLEQLEYLGRTRFRKYFPRRPFYSENKILHSQALFPSGLGREINRLKPDVILLGWLGNSTLSIREIGNLHAPVVWRLSDMWMFSGAAHYSDDNRYLEGYSRASRPASESGPDINRETFLRKKKFWTAPQHVIAPSNWIAQCVSSSSLTANWPVHVIPNPIDIQTWSPVDRGDARQKLGLPKESKIALFGAGSGLKSFHKGGDLFLQSIKQMQQLEPSEQVDIAAVFGQSSEDFNIGKTRVRFLGRLDDSALRLAYSAADVMVVSSRIDNFPSTALEAQAMGCPVVGFRIGGLPDIVRDGVTGFVVEPFNVLELTKAIGRIASKTPKSTSMRQKSRLNAEKIASPDRVAGEYLRVLELAARKQGPLGQRSLQSPPTEFGN